MKKINSSFLLFLFLLLSLNGCNTKVDNSFTFNNLSDADLIVNFRGSDIKVNIGQKVVVSEIPKGTYNYATSFVIPAGATSSSSSGDVSGTVVIKAGTKILIIYTSSLVNGIFNLTATLTSSDTQSSPTGP